MILCCFYDFMKNVSSYMVIFLSTLAKIQFNHYEMKLWTKLSIIFILGAAQFCSGDDSKLYI